MRYFLFTLSSFVTKSVLALGIVEPTGAAGLVFLAGALL